MSPVEVLSPSRPEAVMSPESRASPSRRDDLVRGDDALLEGGRFIGATEVLERIVQRTPRRERTHHPAIPSPRGGNSLRQLVKLLDGLSRDREPRVCITSKVWRVLAMEEKRSYMAGVSDCLCALSRGALRPISSLREAENAVRRPEHVVSNMIDSILSVAIALERENFGGVQGSPTSKDGEAEPEIQESRPSTDDQNTLISMPPDMTPTFYVPHDTASITVSDDDGSSAHGSSPNSPKTRRSEVESVAGSMAPVRDDDSDCVNIEIDRNESKSARQKHGAKKKEDSRDIWKFGDEREWNHAQISDMEEGKQKLLLRRAARMTRDDVMVKSNDDLYNLRTKHCGHVRGGTVKVKPDIHDAALRVGASMSLPSLAPRSNAADQVRELQSILRPEQKRKQQQKPVHGFLQGLMGGGASGASAAAASTDFHVLDEAHMDEKAFERYLGGIPDFVLEFTQFVESAFAGDVDRVYRLIDVNANSVVGLSEFLQGLTVMKYLDDTHHRRNKPACKRLFGFLNTAKNGKVLPNDFCGLSFVREAMATYKDVAVNGTPDDSPILDEDTLDAVKSRFRSIREANVIEERDAARNYFPSAGDFVTLAGRRGGVGRQSQSHGRSSKRKTKAMPTTLARNAPAR